jgi:arginase family enzyme
LRHPHDPWPRGGGDARGRDRRAILDHVGDGPCYVTFDIDCLDPAFAPGTGTPVAGGPSSAKMLSVLRALGGLNMVGADIVEVAPAYDHADITAIAGASVAHALCRADRGEACDATTLRDRFKPAGARFRIEASTS